MIDVRWTINVSPDGTVTEDTEIEPWAPDDMTEEEALTFVEKMKNLWEKVLMLKGPSSALDVLLGLM
jgi:hypothetical protein